MPLPTRRSEEIELLELAAMENAEISNLIMDVDEADIVDVLEPYNENVQAAAIVKKSEEMSVVIMDEITGGEGKEIQHDLPSINGPDTVILSIEPSSDNEDLISIGSSTFELPANLNNFNNLLGNTVTIQSLMEMLQKHFLTTSRLGRNTKVVNIADGKGFSSKTVLLTVQWEPATDLPTDFVVKISDSSCAMHDSELAPGKLEQLLLSHNTECKIFEVFGDHTNIKMPKAFVIQEMDEHTSGIIIMNHIPSSDVFPAGNLPKGVLSQVLRYLAKFHAGYFSLSEEDRSHLQNNLFGSLYKEFVQPEFLMKAANGFHEFLKPVKDICFVSSEEIRTTFEQFASKEYQDFVNSGGNLEMGHVLCHGDVWQNNFLWKVETKNHGYVDWRLLAIIDYQKAHIGSPAGDLVRLLTNCLCTEERRDRWERYVLEYYSYLQDVWNDKRMPFSVEQLKESYKRMFPLCAYIPAAFIVDCGKMLVSKMPEHQRQWASLLIMEKTIGIIEDIVSYHKRNMEILAKTEAEI